MYTCVYIYIYIYTHLVILLSRNSSNHIVLCFGIVAIILATISSS